MRVLITGGAGCLGSSLVSHWAEKGYEITVIDNFLTGSSSQISSSTAISVIDGDINNCEAFTEVVKNSRPEIVVHAAAAYQNPDDWELDVQTNVMGSINLVRALKGLSCLKKIINFQTITCYGSPEATPVNEAHPLLPVSSYGISKVAGEAYMLASDLPVISLRLASVIGPFLSIGPIPTFYSRLKQGKSCFCTDAKRDFLDIQDFLVLMDKVVESGVRTGVFNVASGCNNSIERVYRIVERHLGLERIDVPIVTVGDDDIAELPLDVSSIRNTFNWAPRVSFEETIKKQLEWYDIYGVGSLRSHLKKS